MNTLNTTRAGKPSMESMFKKAKTETPMHRLDDEMIADDLEPLQVSPKWQPHAPPSHPPMEKIFRFCRENKWNKVLEYVNQYPLIGNHSMTMDNHITTTIIHQAITSKGDTAVRARVISSILKHTPEAAQTKNGYGSMPLHVIAQRNTKIDSNTKERLINEIIDAYPEALTEAGGVGKRTPLHIIFTDYVSARLTKRMVDLGAKACFMKDKHGYLPAHVACRRHTSPDKLRMLLTVNPGALYDRNNDGRDLLALAEYHATKSHPNYALIEELKRQMKTTPVDQSSVAAASVPAVSSDDTSEGRERLDSSEVYPRSWPEYSNGGHHEYGYDDRHHGPHHNGAPQGPYEPLVVSYQTLHETHGPPDHRQFAHAPPRLQTFQYDQRDLAPIPYSPSGASVMVSGSHGTYETVPYHQHEAANPEHRDNGAERFHFIDHGGRIYRDPAPYYGEQGHDRTHHHHRNGAPPTFRRHYEHHHTEQPSMHHHHNGNHHRLHHRGMNPPAYTTQIVKHQRLEYHEQPRDNGSVHASQNTGNRFSRHIETFMEAPAPAYIGETFNTHNSPRFADLSPHSTDVVAEFGQHHPPKPTSAPSNGRKRKGHFFRDDEPNEPQVVPDVQEAAGASLLLHFSRQSGHDSADEKSPEEMANDADGKKGYKGADLLFEV